MKTWGMLGIATICAIACVTLAPGNDWTGGHRRWWRGEWADLGMGEHQVRRDEGRIEKSFGIAVMAYVFLIRVCAHELRLGQSWSVSHLQHAFRLRMKITNQVEHNVKTRLAKSRKAA
jgi:hypothetical protein